jgi:hypothetical protein
LRTKYPLGDQVANQWTSVGVGLMYNTDYGSGGLSRFLSVGFAVPQANVPGAVNLNEVATYDSALITNLEDWRVLKIEKKNAIYNIYVDNVLVKTIAHDHKLGPDKLKRISVLFPGKNG